MKPALIQLQLPDTHLYPVKVPCSPYLHDYAAEVPRTVNIQSTSLSQVSH